MLIDMPMENSVIDRFVFLRIQGRLDFHRSAASISGTLVRVLLDALMELEWIDAEGIGKKGSWMYIRRWLPGNHLLAVTSRYVAKIHGLKLDVDSKVLLQGALDHLSGAELGIVGADQGKSALCRIQAGSLKVSFRLLRIIGWSALCRWCPRKQSGTMAVNRTVASPFTATCTIASLSMAEASALRKSILLNGATLVVDHHKVVGGTRLAVTGSDRRSPQYGSRPPSQLR